MSLRDQSIVVQAEDTPPLAPLAAKAAKRRARVRQIIIDVREQAAKLALAKG